MTAEHDLTGKNSPRRVESYRSGLAHIVPFADVWVRLGDSVTIDRPGHGPLTASGRGGTITGTVVAYSSDLPGMSGGPYAERLVLAKTELIVLVEQARVHSELVASQWVDVDRDRETADD